MRAGEGAATITGAGVPVRAMIRAIERGLRRVFGADLTVVYTPAYRPPLSWIETDAGLNPRRADFAVWYWLETHALPPRKLRVPEPAAFEELALVHSDEYLESLSRPETLARIFSVEAWGLPVDELLHMVRLACGGTIQAAREAVRTARPVVNTLGGFHHAGRSRGGGFCAVNDIAVAAAVVRREGLSGLIAVLDLDAHPPDGTAECLRDDGRVFLGSLSGSDWGPLEGVDETVLPDGCGDQEYLRALDALLARMPRPALAFVVAGGDVVAGDRFGRLGLTLDGARARDARVAQALETIPSVWLPGGGYHPAAWRVLAATGLVLAGRPRALIPPDYDPMAARFRRIARRLREEQLAGDAQLTDSDVDEALGRRAPVTPRLLGFYSKQGVEYGLFRYGLLDQIRRLGYGALRVDLDAAGAGDRLRVFGTSDGREHLLIEMVLKREQIAAGEFLAASWLALRNPRARFSAVHPQLPGQDVPGLGLALEVTELLSQIARRLGLRGVVFRPAWYHVAFAARHQFRFIEPGRQGRFEAMIRDFGGVPLLIASLAVKDGRVQMNGEPYRWEPDDMAHWLDEGPKDLDSIAAERERVRFTLVIAPEPT